MLVVDGFRRKRCDGTIQEADLARDLVVDGDVGAHLAAAARIINGWMKFRELVPLLTSRDERSSVCQLCQK